MAEPDIRVDTTALENAGAEIARTGAAIRSAVQDTVATAGDPAWSDAFDSVGATARVGALWREALERTATDVAECGSALRASAAAWKAADEAVAESLRTG